MAQRRPTIAENGHHTGSPRCTLLASKFQMFWNQNWGATRLGGCESYRNTNSMHAMCHTHLSKLYRIPQHSMGARLAWFCFLRLWQEKACYVKSEQLIGILFGAQTSQFTLFLVEITYRNIFEHGRPCKISLFFPPYRASSCIVLCDLVGLCLFFLRNLALSWIRTWYV